jgi:O-methyltransferase
MNRAIEPLRNLAKNLLCKSNSKLLRCWIPVWRFHMSPQVLCFLCRMIDETRSLPGPIVEIGCASGDTTLFLNKHMDVAGIDKPYICIDTFSGFTTTDIEYEAWARNKANKEFLSATFARNSKRWFDKGMEINGLRRVRSIQADVNEFDFAGLEEISLCLVDVDLYRPVKSALEKVYPRMARGGVIVVDDCVPWQPGPSADNWDGAYEAYLEFASQYGFTEETGAGKLALIRIPHQLEAHDAASIEEQTV